MLTTVSEYGGPDRRNLGPALYYGLYPFVRVLGLDAGAWTFALTVNLGAVGLVFWAVRRHIGGARAATVATLTMAMAHITNGGAMSHSLNTEVVLLPMFCCFVLAWIVSTGDLVVLPVLAVVSTFVVQTYVGGALPVVAAVLVAVGFVVGRRAFGTGGLRRSVIVTAVITGIMWIPTAWDQVRGTGNFVGLARTDIAGRGLSGAWATVQRTFDVTALFDRTSGPTVLDRASPAFVVLVIVLLIGLVAVPVTRRVVAARCGLVAVVLAAIVGAAATTFAAPPTDTATYHYFHVGAAGGTRSSSPSS